MIGRRLGPYEITAKLGEGGMGEVYRATDTRLKRDVAIKVLPAAFSEDKERLARFEREAQVLAQLNHPNIAAIHGLEESGEVHALVIELVEGPTLAERLEQGPLSLSEGLSISLQIAQALEEAHEKGIVHRDLKPQNIKSSMEGKVKVLDFGLAKAMDPMGVAALSPHDLAHSPTLTFGGTREGVILGTAAYMAPEQARGGAIDKRVDIWSFGVVLYEMFSGERLFGEGSVVDTLSAVMRKEIDLSRLPASVPTRMRELIRRCLERDPKRRLRDIGEARLALEAEISAPADDVGAAKVPEHAARSTSRALPVGLASAVLLAGGLLGVLVAKSLLRPTEVEPVHVHTLTYSGADSEPSASPDGKLIAFTSRRDGVSRIWIRQLVGGGEAPLTAGPDRLPRFSPDGSSVLFVRDLGTTQAVFRTGLVGGELHRLVDNATEVDGSPDGRRVVFVRTRDGAKSVAQLGLFDLATGQERVLADLGDVLLRSPRWSPNGRTIVVAAGTFSAPDWKIEMVDVASGQVKAVPPGKPDIAMGGFTWSGRGESFFFVQSPSVMGEIVGASSRIVRCDAASGERRTILWSDGLSWLNSTIGSISQLDVLAPGRLLLGQRLERQNLREVAFDGSDTNSATRWLSTGSSIDRQPVYSPDGRQLLFSSNRGGNLDLWTIDLSSGALRQVTDDPAQDWDPEFLPDGRILWDSYRETGHLEVWIANADGSSARLVTRDGVSAQNPMATRDGNWIVYWSGNPEKFGVWKIHPDGSGAVELQKARDPAISEVSPDGRYASWVEQDRLGLRNTVRFLEVESGRILPLTIDVRYTVGAPGILWGRARWTPDGRSILFVGENERGLSGIYEQEFAPEGDSPATRRPVAGFSPDFVTESFGISPDGARLTLSLKQETSSILVAEGVSGAMPPIRKTP